MAPPLIPQPLREYLLAVQEGLIPGRSIVSKFGENPNIDTADGHEAIWDEATVYAPPKAPRIHAIISTSAEDTGLLVASGTMDNHTGFTLTDSDATFISDSVAIGDLVLDDDDATHAMVTEVVSETELAMAGGWRYAKDHTFFVPHHDCDVYRIVRSAATGAAVIYLEGIGADLKEQDEFVVLDGTTPGIDTTQTFYRISRALVFGTSTATSAIGDVSAVADVDGTTTLTILATHNQTLMAIYTIPINKIGYIFNWWTSMSKSNLTGTVNARLRSGDTNGYDYIDQSRSITAGGNSDFSASLPYIRMAPGFDIYVEANSTVNSMSVSAGFDILLVDI